jgi:hypothetical protein
VKRTSVLGAAWNGQNSEEARLEETFELLRDSSKMSEVPIVIFCAFRTHSSTKIAHWSQKVFPTARHQVNSSSKCVIHFR